MESGRSNIARRSLLLKPIADREIMNLPFIRDCSLFEGMTGLSIFFAFLSKAEKNTAYEDIAEYVLNRVCDGIPEDISLDFCYGITGIGWGIIFLKNRGFIDSDISCILTDLDAIIYNRMLNVRAEGLNDDELSGICKYVQAREDQDSTECNLPYDSVLNKLNMEVVKRGIDLQSGIWEETKIWEGCLEYWRQTSSEENLSWKSGILIMEETFSSTGSLINMIPDYLIPSNIKLKDETDIQI